MILNTESRQGTMLQTFNSVVVQVDVCDFHIIQIQALRVHCKTVILSCNLHLLALKIQNRMITAVMPKLQLVSLPA